MRDISVCFTGHRFLSYEERTALQAKLSETLEALYTRGFRHFYAGGAMGFDTLAAKAVLRLKQNYCDVSLCLILPCKNQADRWSAPIKAEYEHILSMADSIDYVCEHYVTGCMQLRNKRLVEASSVCVCFLKKGGGTAYTVNYAREQALEIINLL